MNRILIVDDEPNLRFLYEYEFRRLGYSTISAANAKQGLEYVKTMNPDLVILDIRMPGMDGVEALQHILARNSTIPVILNTAYSRFYGKYLTWAADACLRKSSDLTELIETVRRLLPERQAREPLPKSSSLIKTDKHEGQNHVEQLQ